MTERFVLDTSVFTNPDIYAQFGTDSPNAILGFLELVRQTSVQCFMPRSVYDELRLMKNLGKLPPEFEASVRIRSPRKFTLQIPAQIVYELIEEVRKRIDRASTSPRNMPRRHGKLARSRIRDESSTGSGSVTGKHCGRVSSTAGRTWTCCFWHTNWTAS